MNSNATLPKYSQAAPQAVQAVAKSLGALCLALLLIFAFATAPSLACIGEIPGFPRAIKLDTDKSAQVGGLPVRVFELSGKEWFIPNPSGFSDIELKQRAQLECWEEVAAYNLSNSNLAYFAAASGLPEFSQAHIYIEGDQAGAKHYADFRLTEGTPSDDAAISQALIKNLTEGKAIGTEIFAKAVANAGSCRPYAIIEKNGQEILVKLAIVEGRITDEDAKAKEEMWKNYEKGPVTNPDGTVTYPDFPPVGDGNVSFFPCINASLVFKNGNKYVSMLLEYGPIENQGQIGEAVDILLTWKNNFEKLNQ